MSELGRRVSTWFCPLVLLTLLQCSKKAEEGSGQTGVDESFLDHSVDPCSDFYQFACGTWIKEHPVDKYGSQEHYTDGEARSSFLLRKILETDAANTPYVADRDAPLLGRYYDSCLNSRISTTVSHVPLDAMLATISRIASLDDLARTVATLHANGISAFFWAGTPSDPGNPTRAITTLFSSGWNLDGSYFVKDPMTVWSEYADHIARSAALFGTTIDSAAVIAVESALGGNALSLDARRDPNATYHLTPLADFTASSPTFPWSSYFAAAAFPAITEVNVTDPSYFTMLDALFGAQTLDAMRHYLRWQVLETYANTLGQTFVVEEARFHFGNLYGDTTPFPDWWACQKSAESAYGFSLARPFVSAFFDEEKKKAALKILSSVRSAFRLEIQSRDWIDAATRAEAETKLDKIVDKVGYPDSWPDPIVPAPTDGTFLQWWLQIEQAWRAEAIAKLSTGVDRTVWRTAPTVLNAFYSSDFNEIVFPAAILQTPAFAVDRASAVNYGTIGEIMGHELTHGFDDRGRQYDGDGKLRDWWTPNVDAEYVRRAACVADQYSQYEPIPGQTIDGQLTLSENIADLGGLKLAYAAYKAAEPTESFAGSFDADQQFFLSFAQLRCANFRDTITASRLRSDTHAPDKYRVNGVVRNLAQFASAFSCPAGSPMAPATRCDVW